MKDLILRIKTLYKKNQQLKKNQQIEENVVPRFLGKNTTKIVNKVLKVNYFLWVETN